MILTCPDCATSYYVPDSAIGQDGRKVRCASCGFSWRAEPEPGRPRFARDPAAPDPDPEGFEEEPDGFAELTAQEDVLAFAPPPPTKARGLEPRAVKAIAWGAAAGAVVLAAGAALALRTEVVRIWPSAAGAYARVGLPVNTVGLALQEVSAKRQLRAGRPALVVSGVMRNIRGQSVEPPPLSVTFLDRTGKVLATKTAPAALSPLASGAQRRFSVDLSDPPRAASELEVSFVTGPRLIGAP